MYDIAPAEPANMMASHSGHFFVSCIVVLAKSEPAKAVSEHLGSGLPDDSRGEDERRLRELRACVRRARAVVASTPGLEDTLSSDWRKAARFCARFGIAEGMLRSRVPAEHRGTGADLTVGPWIPYDGVAE